MSDRIANQRLYVLVKRGIASFALVFAFGIFLVPQTAFALDETTPETGAPTEMLPATCTALLGLTPPPVVPVTPPAPETPVEGETPEAPAETPETPEVPVAPVWSPLALTTTATTSNPTLTWNWSAPTSTNPEATYSGYGFALYTGDTLVSNGTLAADVQQYSYTTTTNGSYRLFVWLLDSTVDPAVPVATSCEYSDSTFTSVPPVVVVDGKGYTLLPNGTTATPTISVVQPGVTYSWSVNANNSAVTINDAALLTPIFTFLKDGTYEFILTATDLFGSVTTTALTITYTTPYVPIPPVIFEPVLPYVPPVVALASAQRTTSNETNYSAVASTDVATTTDTRSSLSGVAGATNDDLSAPAVTSAQTIQPSAQGWILLGVPWYWWVIGLLIIVSAVQWYRSGVFRKRPDDL